MKLLENILLATDFSKSCENVVENAIDLAKTFDSKIILVHVIPDDIKNEKVTSFIKHTALEQLEQINNKIKIKGVKTTEPILRFGNHCDKIIQVANRLRANIILIGAGEKLKSDAFRLGTTAEKLIRMSVRPVWVVKKDIPMNVRSIFCPVDFSQESKRALKNAITIARRFKAELIIFSVYDVNYMNPQSYKFNWEEEIETLLSAHLKEFDSFLKEFNLIDLSWDKETRKGDPAKEILKGIERYKSDLLIMGTTGKSGLIRILMGSVTEKVIREVPCSFITLKLENAIELILESKIRDIESCYDTAKQLMEDGFYEESLNEFENCLNINDMHIPSLNGIAKVYKKMGDNAKYKSYNNKAKEVLVRVTDFNIEDEIRKFYRL